MDTDVGVDAFVRTVAANIRTLRRDAGLTLAELATEAGLGKSTLAQLESGRSPKEVTSELDMHPYAAKMLVQKVRATSLEEIRETIDYGVISATGRSDVGIATYENATTPPSHIEIAMTCR